MGFFGSPGRFISALFAICWKAHLAVYLRMRHALLGVNGRASLQISENLSASRMTLAMYFEIEGSNVRVGGTMHRVPQGQPLAHWVHDAICWASLIYLEHAKDDSYHGRNAPPGSRPLVHRLPRSWPRIERKCQFDLVRWHHLSRLRPFAVLWEILEPVPTDEGVEHLALARSKENRPSGPRINYLETNDQAYALADGVSDAVWDDAVNWALDNPESFKMVLERSYRA